MPTSPPDLRLSRTQVLIAVAITAVLLLLGAKLWIWLGRVVQLPLVWQPDLALAGLGLGLGLTLLSQWLYRVWATYRRSADHYLDLVIRPLETPDLIWIALLPAMSEELLFRGVMLPYFGLDLGGVMITALVFGALHWGGAHQWPYALVTTGVGLCFGGVALLTQNLLVPLLAHAIVNLLSALLWRRTAAPARE
jgi:membrane protease YdiL (CAAX protease family)